MTSVILMVRMTRDLKRSRSSRLQVTIHSIILCSLSATGTPLRATNIQDLGLKQARRVSVKQHPYYAPFAVRALRNLAAQYGKHRVNHFYVSKVEEDGGGIPTVWVYWKEERLITTWDAHTGFSESGDYAPELDLTHAWPRHVWRLDKDLVKGQYANGNDALREQDAAEIIKDCKTEGDLFVIKARK